MYYSISLAELESSRRRPSPTCNLQPQIDEHACSAQSLPSIAWSSINHPLLSTTFPTTKIDLMNSILSQYTCLNDVQMRPRKTQFLSL